MKDEPLNGHQLSELMSEMNERLNIMVDRDVKSNTTIEEIFSNRGNVVFYHPWINRDGSEQDVGHWVCMVRNKDMNQAYYFDSFGKRPYNKAIEQVCIRAGYQFLFNNIVFQPDESSACGKYCLLVIALNKMGLNPCQIEAFMKSHGKKINEFVLRTVK